jgi:hypothetical protein
MLELMQSLRSSPETALTLVIAGDAAAVGHAAQASIHVAGRLSDRLLVEAFDDGDSGREEDPRGRHLEFPVLLWPVDEPAPRSFAEAAHSRRINHRRIARPETLKLDVRRRLVSVGETSLVLPAMQFFWLYYLALAPGGQFPLAEITASLERSRGSIPQLTQRLPDGRVRHLPADVRRAFAVIFPKAGDKFEAMYRNACGPPPNLPSTISKINRALRTALGSGASPYLIQGGRGAGGYRLTLPPGAVQIDAAE